MTVSISAPVAKSAQSTAATSVPPHGNGRASLKGLANVDPRLVSLPATP